MVMEASPSPSPQSVGREFVRQYYTLLNKAPTHLHRFYNNYSSFVHGGLDAPHRETLPVVGQKQIHNRIQQLNFRDCHAKISQVDSQATLGNGVVVQVTGELSNGGAPMRRFTQTFVLAAQSPKKYYVHNDIFRYQDLVPEDEEPASPSEPAGYFPPPPFPPSFPAPPSLPPAALQPAPAPAPAPQPEPEPAPQPQLNGHQQEPARHLPAHSAAPAVPCEPSPSPVPAPPPAAAAPPPAPAPAPAPAPEPAPEPEPARDPTPPPVQSPPQPAVPPEPKTYANLLKSSAPVTHVSVTHVSVTHAAVTPAPVPHAPAPQDQRPRAARPPRDSQPTEGGRGERGSRGGGGGGGGGGEERGEATAGSGAPARRYSDSQQLFLGNVPPTATEEELRALFSRFGPVAELRVLGRPPHPHYGFLTYESARHAQDCLSAQPLYFPADSPDGVKLNVEEKKARGAAGRGGDAAPHRRRPTSAHRAFPPRQPQHYRR